MSKQKNCQDLKEILDRIPVGVFILDSGYGVVYWNTIMADWTGIESGDIEGEDIRSRYPHIKNERYSARISSVLQGGPPVVFSAQLHGSLIPAKTPLGQPRVQHTIITGYSQDGRGTLAMVTIQDVTDLNQKISTLRALKDEAVRDKNLAQMYLDIAGVIILELDQNMRIKTLNRKGSEMLGIGEAEAVGVDWKDFLPADEREKVALAFQAVMDDRACMDETVENRVLTRDGRILVVSWKNAPVRGPDGKVKSIISSGEDITEKHRFIDLLVQKSVTDPLTGIYNRAYFFETAQNELRFARRTGQDFVIAVMDLDFFKKINDTHGHQAGDLVIQFFCDIVRKCVRDYDILARYGGEEFVLFFRNTGMEVAVRVMARVTLSLERNPPVYQATSIPITYSAGLASYSELKASCDPDIDQVIGLADRRLYRAKENGRNCCVCGD